MEISHLLRILISAAVVLPDIPPQYVDCNLQSRRKSFIEDTASVTGSHPSTIARHIKIATELTPEAKKTLRGAKKPHWRGLWSRRQNKPYPSWQRFALLEISHLLRIALICWMEGGVYPYPRVPHHLLQSPAPGVIQREKWF